jgi:hypothetical protein
MIKLLYNLLTLIFLFSFQLQAQTDESDVLFVKDIYNSTLTESTCYDWLRYLTKEIGGRIAGSPESMAAVFYTKQVMDTLGLTNTKLQECEELLILQHMELKN